MRQENNKDIFYIAGAQKCGTTAIWQYLSLHKNIVAPQIKESHFFSCDQRYRQGYAHYIDMLGQNESGKLRFDASPSYLNSQDAHVRLNEFNPDAKIILILRDPVERAFSAWNMYCPRFKKNNNWFFDEWLSACSGNHHFVKKRNPETLLDFEKYVFEEIDFLESNADMRIEAPILPQGQYHRQIQNLLRFFRREQIFIIHSAELRADTLATLRKLEAFLEIPAHDWADDDLTTVFEGEYSTVMSGAIHAVLADFYAAQNAKLYEFLNRDLAWG
jgi:hypothetical protein